MQKYVILRANITGMGGAQMYTRNKAVYKQHCGFEVYVISSRVGNIIIEDLKKYQSGIFNELQLSPNCFPMKKLEITLKKLLGYINYSENDEVFIESNDVVMSLWGELIASKTDAKHVSFILNEHFGNFERCFTEYFRFKNERGELAGIRESILSDYFGDEENAKYKKLIAVMSNNVDDCYSPVLDEIDKERINIASIGRLDKAYVPTLINELVILAQKYPDQGFDITFIGDSQESKIKKVIHKKLSNVNNIRYRITGFVYPVPKKLFPMINVFVSAAGSAWMSYYEKRPTVSIDVDTYKAIGVLGYSTNNTLKALNDDNPIPVSEAIESVLFGEAKKCIYKEQSSTSMDDRLKEHDDYWDTGSEINSYYNFSSVKKLKIEKILNTLMTLFGIRFTVNVLFSIIQKIRKRK